MSRRWQRTETTGELGLCRCSPSPIGPEPATVIRGGRSPTLERGGVEHTCPTAELAPRPAGRRPTGEAASDRLVILLPASLKERVTRAAGGAGRVSEWARPLLEAAAGEATPAARATSERSRDRAQPGSSAGPRRRRR